MIQLFCPRCRTDLQVEASAARISCTACRESFECLFLRNTEEAPPPVRPRAGVAAGAAGAASKWGVCTNHPSNDATARCRECRKAICAVCVFSLHGGRYCPECASNPKQGAPASVTKAVGSIVLSIVAILTMCGSSFYLATSASSRAAEAVAQLMGMVVLLSAFGGTALGFVAKDEARRAGSPLAVVGIVMNLLVLGFLVLASVAGSLGVQ